MVRCQYTLIGHARASGRAPLALGLCVYALLEWAGAPYEAELRPLVLDGTVRVNGRALAERVRLVPSTNIEIGAFRLELVYPKSMTLRR